MPRAHDRRPRLRALAALLLGTTFCIATATAQTPKAPTPNAAAKTPAAKSPAAPSPTTQPAPQLAAAIRSFTAPDGSRFVLVQDTSMGQVEWTVATSTDPANEPAGLEGLATAVAKSSMLGTWQTGSTDTKRERTALTELDQAFQQLIVAPLNPEARARVVTAGNEAAQLADPDAFLRVLASLPANRPEVTSVDGVCMFQLTTLPDAIGAVGAMLVERREEQALRDLGAQWVREVMTRQVSYDANPTSAVRAELLALALPNQPASRAAERAGRSIPLREQAMQVWRTTQHPARTVHVLLGNLNLAAAESTLCRVFASTSLPAPPAAQPPPLRPIQSMRRSTVPGSRVPMVAFAWILPEVKDPFLLEVASQWFGNGPDSWLGRELLRAGRKTGLTLCRAPWPAAIQGRSLLLVEVQDPTGVNGLADQILAAATKSLKQPPGQAELTSVITDLQLAWTTATTKPRMRAGELAQAALLWPESPPRLTIPETVDPRQIQQLLQQIFASQPVIVEGRQ
jgi:predicted Zn-dependent peptidase